MGRLHENSRPTSIPNLSRFHAYNIGHLSSRASSPLFVPCTPAGVFRLLKSTGVAIEGANAVVIGRSDIVGNPVASILRNADATVTQCHSKTRNLEAIVCNVVTVRPSLTALPRLKMPTLLSQPLEKLNT